MSFQTVTLVKACVRCGGNSGAEVTAGTAVRIWLDQSATPAFPQYIPGSVGVVLAGDVSSEYTISYDDTSLNGAAPYLRACDILELTCDSCCDILQEQINAWAEATKPVVYASYQWISNGKVQLFASAYSTVPAVTLTKFRWLDSEGTELADTGTTPSWSITDSEATAFMGGLYYVEVTDSLGHITTVPVVVDPTNVKERMVSSVLLSGQSSVEVPLNEFETISGVIQTTAGSGVSLESAEVTDDTATLQFTNVAPFDVNLTIKITRLKFVS